MIKIKAQMPGAIQFRPIRTWWPRFVACWRQLTAEHGGVDRQAMLTDVIERGVADLEAELANKKKQ